MVGNAGAPTTPQSPHIPSTAISYQPPSQGVGSHQSVANDNVAVVSSIFTSRVADGNVCPHPVNGATKHTIKRMYDLNPMAVT